MSSSPFDVALQNIGLESSQAAPRAREYCDGFETQLQDIFERLEGWLSAAVTYEGDLVAREQASEEAATAGETAQGRQIVALQAEVEGLQADRDTHSARCQTLEAERIEAEAKWTQRCTELGNELAEANQRVAELIEAGTRSATERTEQVLTLEAEIERLQADCQRHLNRCQALEAERKVAESKLTKRCTELSVELGEAHQRIAELAEATIASGADEAERIVELEEEIQRLRAERQEHAGRDQTLEADRAEAESQLTQRCAELNFELARANQRVEKLTELVRKQKTQLDTERRQGAEELKEMRKLLERQTELLLASAANSGASKEMAASVDSARQTAEPRSAASSPPERPHLSVVRNQFEKIRSDRAAAQRELKNGRR